MGVEFVSRCATLDAQNLVNRVLWLIGVKSLLFVALECLVEVIVKLQFVVQFTFQSNQVGIEQKLSDVILVDEITIFVIILIEHLIFHNRFVDVWL